MPEHWLHPNIGLEESATWPKTDLDD